MKSIPIYKQNFCDFNLLLCLAFSFIALLFSLLNEFLWKIEPCRFCIWQRIPYFLIFFMSLLGLILPSLHRLIYCLIWISFLGSFILASTHLLIQLGVIPDYCTVPQSIKTLDDFQNMLDKNNPSCAKASWQLLGLPIASYNAMFSLFFLWRMGSYQVYK